MGGECQGGAGPLEIVVLQGRFVGGDVREVAKALKEEQAMTRRVSRLIGLGGLAVHLCLLSGVVAHAQPASPYPLDDKLANQPAPWTVQGPVGCARQLGTVGRGGSPRHAQLHHPGADRAGGRAGEARQGLPARRGDAQRPAPRHHAQPRRRADHHGERRLRSGHAARAIRSQAVAGRGQLHRHAQPRGHAPGHLRPHLSRERALQQHAAAQAGRHDPRRCGERAVHGRARRPPRRGEVQGPGSAPREILDHARGSPEHGQGAERGDPQGRHSA